MKWAKLLILIVLIFNSNVSYAKELRAKPIFKVNIPSPQKVIAITFDDGPDPSNTPKLLEVLHQEGIKATFFVLGIRANKYPSFLKEIAMAGHEIENHGYSHQEPRKLSAKQLAWEIRNTDRIILKYVKRKPHFFRPPYGQVTSVVKMAAYDAQYQLIEWSIDPRDWEKGKIAQKIQYAVVSQIHSGDIVLLHDGGGDRRETIKAVRALVQDLKSKGYTFTTLTDLVKMNGNYWE
jgi:peptidoglycan-N-acetylglucosamine deacetylase